MTRRTRVKVCGIRDPESAAVAANAGADTIGFIFVEDSPRYVSPQVAAGIMMSLPPLVSAAGVTRDLTVEQFNDLYIECPTQVSQFHGKEDEKTLSDCCGPCNVKAFRYDATTIASQLKRWGAMEEIDAVLIDGGDGGEGVSMDWNELAGHLEGFTKPVFLAGGLTPENVAEAIRVVRPYAVDVSSGVESSPGVKDHDKIRAFLRAVQAADAG